ncbi:MAG: hybrid sensor histidine kinase/response regulator [SAR202 cluster bacterium]|nr:hybrid sensor histidine kinase/response regulator [SAR202 cluster bacterium]
MDKDARILIVDDTRANLDVLCEFLDGEGYTVSLAPNGEVALRIASRMVPDLVLLDVMMPGIDGFEVCRRLKADAKTAEVPIIFITAEDETHRVVMGFDVGGIDYIKKPFRDREVLARVRTHLNVDRLTRELSDKNGELERANAQIQVVSDRKSQFVANLSHELRTPINAIIGFNRMVLRKEGEKLSDQHRQNLGKALDAANNMLEMINDLLDLSKIEAGKMEISAQRVDVGTLVKSCCAEIEPLVHDGVSLRFQVDDRQWRVCSDRAKLRQLLINLLSNAAKFTGAGSIDVRASVDGGALRFVVADTGIGIPEEALESIFDEFKQASTTATGKGTGLGLPITRATAQLLGGSVHVASQVGKGSTFTVTIPANTTEDALVNAHDSRGTFG